MLRKRPLTVRSTSKHSESDTCLPRNAPNSLGWTRRQSQDGKGDSSGSERISPGHELGAILQARMQQGGGLVV